MLINIDNGGTFTDVCVIDGDKTFRAKTPTTPFDLSECFFEGLRQVSGQVFGHENVAGLLAGTERIRYSTTQGTNALVQRNGPRLGLLLQSGCDLAELKSPPHMAELFDDLIDGRVSFIDFSLSDQAFESQIVGFINELTLAGANRLVLSVMHQDQEERVERIIGEHFPEHLLGTVPVVAAGQLSRDPDLSRRTWSALFNAFLHPSMEKFLYYAENRLRDQKFLSPLLIYRNDGDSGRVAKTVAIKSYSSGPRGGMDGVAALARHYGYRDVLSMDVGGTTTDIGAFIADEIRERQFGQVEGVDIAFPLTDIVSAGVGGGSKIRAEKSSVAVGPESVGAAPGPACFGLGGTDATITDYALLAGIIDPATYFGGSMALDAQRANNAVMEHVARPLNLELDAALEAMKQAWVKKVAEALLEFTQISSDTVLAAFGGAGPLAVCSVAEAAGIGRIVIPKLAPVFCAFGIGFSDLGHTYERELPAGLSEADCCDHLDELKRDALEDMQAEGCAANECDFEFSSAVTEDGQQRVVAIRNAKDLHQLIDTSGRAVLRLRVSAALASPRLSDNSMVAQGAHAQANGQRQILLGKQRLEVPLYRLEELPLGAEAVGPAIIEDPFFTLTVLPEWNFQISASGDILLSNAKGA